MRFQAVKSPLDVNTLLQNPQCLNEPAGGFTGNNFFMYREDSTTQTRASTQELELELIQTQMAQKPMLLAEVYARALSASQNVKRAEVWVGARCALRVGGAWASAGVEGTRMGWRDL